MKTFFGARLFDGDRFLDDHALVVEHGAIRAIVDVAERPRAGEQIDCGGGILAPGLVDWQVNGGGGVLFNGDPTVEAIAAIVRATPGLTAARLYTPERAHDPYLDDGAPPPLVLQLYLETIGALEAAVGAGGHLQALAARLPRATHQAMLARDFWVPDPTLRTPAGALPCTYLVHYPGPAEDLNAWLRHYIANHPPIMARFPGIREIEICTRLDWCDALPWPRVDAMQRNKVVFDDAAALHAALNSPVRHEMRADFREFPPFGGGNTHFPMLTKEVRKEGF